jgi:Uncharacterized conserved protein
LGFGQVWQIRKRAHNELKGTTSAVKNNILFEKFNINYNSEQDIFKKGTVMVKPNFQPLHVDIFHNDFYQAHGISD